MSTREQALLTWGIIAILIIMVIPVLRSALKDILAKCIIVIKEPAGIIVWIYQVIVIGFVYFFISKWNQDMWLIKDYILVAFITIFPYLFMKPTYGARQSFIESFTIMALWTIFIDTYTFSYQWEMILVPVVFILVVMSTVGEMKKLNSMALYSQILLTGVLTVYVGNGIFQFISNFSNVQWKDMFLQYTVEPIAWIMNVPLLILSIPLRRYDIYINFLDKKKTPLRLFCRSTLFLIMQFYWRMINVTKERKHVTKVNQGGAAALRLDVYVTDDTSNKEISKIKNMYRYMLAPVSDYKDENPIIPLSIRIKLDNADKDVILHYKDKAIEENYVTFF